MQSAEGSMEVLFPVAAGIDVHRDTVVVSLRRRTERGRELVETRTFATFHDELVQMVAWLDKEEVPVVGLESTGVYWKPVVRALRKGLPTRVIWLVNPAEVKKVPGRKTDVTDSQWLSKLVMHGLVSPSYLPPEDLEELRKLTRFRTQVVGNQTRCKNRILKELEASGIKLASVCSEVLGASGRAMLTALLKGDQTPAQIAELARGRLRTKRAQLERAVQGSFTEATAIILRHLLADLARTEGNLEALDREIQQRLKRYQREVDLLLTSPGLDRVGIASVIAEIGPDMSIFEAADRLAAWGGLCPGSNESAGKSKRAPTRQGDKYLRTTLVQVAWAAKNTRGCFWRQKYHQLIPKLGKQRTIVAIARKILVAIFYMLRDGVPYQAPPAPVPSASRAKQMVQQYTARLAALGFDVQLTPLAAATAPALPTEPLAQVAAPAV
jgi:transposase